MRKREYNSENELVRLLDKKFQELRNQGTPFSMTDVEKVIMDNMEIFDLSISNFWRISKFFQMKFFGRASPGEAKVN